MIYGPIYPITTSFIAIRDLDDTSSAFRIAANGIVLEIDQSYLVSKKIKLIGNPFKIFKNTAFIKDMFNSALEVAKYEGAKLKTVSGIRGTIKKALSSEGPEGSY